MKYNNKIQSIPSNIIAGMFGFKPREYFEAEAGRDRGAQGPVLSDGRVARRRRPRPRSSLSIDLRGSRCTNRSPRTSARPFVLIFGFVVLLFLVGAAFNFLLSGGVVGIVIVAVIVIVVVGRVVLQQRQGRARDLARASRPIRAAVRAPLQPRRGLVHRERAAEAAPLHHRRSRAERVLDRPQPEARGGRRHHRACSRR